MELWIVITIAAAFIQNIRSALQKYLKGQMSTTSATFVRFGFGVPFAILYFLVASSFSGGGIPKVGSEFFFWASIAAFAQIVATFALLYLFSFRNFAVGTAYSRTEPAQTAIFALVLFGERLPALGIVAIAISILGVMLISVARTELTIRAMVMSLFSRTALIGLTSGTFFGLSAVSYRAASFAVSHPEFYMQSATTLVFAIALQSFVMFFWIALRTPEQLAMIRKAWVPATVVGVAGATASFGWFTAFTLQQPALVKVVAQIEMLFTFASSVFFFRETITRREVAGCVLITAGIVLLVLL